MKAITFAVFVVAAITLPAWAQAPSDTPRLDGAGAKATDASPAGDFLTKAADGTGIPHPTSTRTDPVTDGTRTILVPEAMVYVPAGDYTVGTGSGAKTAHLDGYCIGRFDVTNAEYKAFLDATGSRRHPSYWTGGTYPEGKANHPVVYVSLTDALAYADWVSKGTGWKVTIPTSDRWEKAARGPKGYLYPWGNTPDTTYANGVLTSKSNFNAVTAAYYLTNHPKMPVTYNNKKSKYFGTRTTVDRIAGYDDAGNPTYLSVGAHGSVRGWVSHATYTGFIYTDLFTALNAAGGNTSAVGSYEAGKSAYGCCDMAGNVWNWCDTRIVATNGAEKGRTVNEIRGGSWYAMGNSCRSVAIGEGRSAAGAYNTVGFRIAMLPAAQP
jgi:formylglycine-generating enzyme required for sulfatase activity